MKIAVVYVFPNLNHRVHYPMAKRFAQTYVNNPPGETEHDLYVASNGMGIDEAQKSLFYPLSPKFFFHDNFGKDIGAYQKAARHIDCDLLVCLGAPLRCNRAGWLDRIVEVYESNGPGLYGCWAFSTPAPHIRTTAFWLPPQLLNSYPHHVSDNGRYNFEHGPTSITNWTRKYGLPVLQVTWTKVCSEKDWHSPAAHEHLLLDQHLERSGI